MEDLPLIDKHGDSISYREFDVNNKVDLKRDNERFVVGSDGTVYYTNSHYKPVDGKPGFHEYIEDSHYQ